MPAKMPMIISNGGFKTISTLSSSVSQNLAKTNAHVSTVASLNTSMITRIHKIKPGCGSCGR